MDIRVSTIPTVDGESIDLRLLPGGGSLRTLENLGMAADQVALLRRQIQRPNGILLVTGPTGHGKTTTLYACLSELNRPEKKLITIEDPVEYRLKGANQVQVHPKIGMGFGQGLRSILRQDPDVIMVGEIRDVETAEIAIRAALTGHFVLSTLHTNDAAGAITRLLDMGIEPHLLASSINAVVAQRLVRQTCPFCKAERPGCESCRDAGFKGRTGIFEFLVIDEEIQRLIMRRTPTSGLREHAVQSGMRTLFRDGERKVIEELTTLQEVRRVTEEL